MNDQYKALYCTLTDCFDQAAKGKGKERHADDKPFEDQPIMWIDEHFKGFQLGQAVKKIHESQILGKDAAIKELRGAIVYICAKIISLEGMEVRVKTLVDAEGFETLYETERL